MNDEYEYEKVQKDYLTNKLNDFIEFKKNARPDTTVCCCGQPLVIDQLSDQFGSYCPNEECNWPAQFKS